jgi:hypothetical protein
VTKSSAVRTHHDGTHRFGVYLDNIVVGLPTRRDACVSRDRKFGEFSRQQILLSWRMISVGLLDGSVDLADDVLLEA